MNNIDIIYSSAVGLLLVLSAFFSASETAFTTSSKAKIHRLAKDGNKKARKVQSLSRNRESMIGTILLANNTVNILASALATSFLISIFGEAGVFYATAIMTALVLVFGEIAPKTLALRYPEKISLFAAPILLFLVKLFYPITKNIQKIIDKIFILFGIVDKNNKNENLASDLEEIRGTIDLKHRAGSIFKYEKDMLDSILDLGETEVVNIMVHRKNIISINIDQDINSILKQAFSIHHNKIPLWRGDEDNIVAILDMKKLIKVLHYNNDLNKISLRQFTIKPWFIPSTNTLRSQLLLFRQKKEKLALVIDEYGALLGMVTVEDILEEIVGDIDDKKIDLNNIRLIKSKDGSYKISGELPVKDINRRLNWNLPESDERTATLAGLIIAKIQRIPDEGEELNFDGYDFKISKVRNNKILFAKISKNR